MALFKKGQKVWLVTLTAQMQYDVEQGEYVKLAQGDDSTHLVRVRRPNDPEGAMVVDRDEFDVFAKQKEALGRAAARANELGMQHLLQSFHLMKRAAEL